MPESSKQLQEIAVAQGKQFLSPFTPSYWKTAFYELKNVRTLAVCSMLLAASIVIGAFLRIPVPLRDNLNIMFDFIPNALAAAIGGPVIAILYGAVADILGYLINPFGAYFPGYMLSSILVMLTFSLFLYRRKISMWRLALSKLIYNFFINVLLGSVWTSMLFGKGYVFYFWSSLAKNAILYPIEVILLFLVFGGLIPPMVKMGLIPAQKTIFIPMLRKLKKDNPFKEE